METYSTYEAKAKFSEVIRKVRAGQTVRIAYRGEEIAEVRPRFVYVDTSYLVSSWPRSAVTRYWSRGGTAWRDQNHKRIDLWTLSPGCVAGDYKGGGACATVGAATWRTVPQWKQRA